MDTVTEISARCRQLLADRIFLISEMGGVPYKEIKVGRVRIYEQNESITVHLYRSVIYTYTSDVVYSEFRGEHRYSNWPLIHDALAILRLEMILDDLSTA